MSGELSILRAIVIGSSNKGDYDKTVKLYTDSGGIIYAIAKGVRRPSAKMKYAVQIFNFGIYELSDSRAGLIISGCEQIRSFYRLTHNIESFYAAGVALEIIDGASETGEFLGLTVEFFRALECTDPLSATLDFLLGFFRKNGGELRFDACAACGGEGKLFLDIFSGGVLCGTCAGKRAVGLSSEVLSVFRGESDRSAVVDALVLLRDYIAAQYFPLKTLNNLIGIARNG